MTFTRNKYKMAAAVLISTILLFNIAAPGAAYAAADPDTLITPGIYDSVDDSVAALKEQLASLEKIIELNVTRADKIPVLLYHHLAKEDELTPAQRQNDSVMSIEQFSEQMKYLYDNKFYTASLYELELYINGKMILPERTVVITFDDGYRSNTKYAYPVLKKYDFKAAIFLITSLIGEKENVIEHASWSDLKKCGDVFSYHSHSHNLHKLARDGSSVFATSDAAAIAEDLLISKALLSTSYLAYPYGQTNRTIKKAAAEAGFRIGFTTAADYARRRIDPMEIPRFTITPNIDQTTFEIICTGLAGSPSANGPADAGDEPDAAAADANV